MATKNLARTAVEGGRFSDYKSERDRIKRTRRANERIHAKKSLYDEYSVMPKTEKLSKRGFQAENLSPIYRFMNRHIGQNWDKVHAKIKKRFDTRTIQSHHIVINHILGEVAPFGWEPGGAGYTSYRYYRDNQNRLRGNEPFRWKGSREPSQSRKKIIDWLNHRVVGQVGEDSFYWFIPTHSIYFVWHYELMTFANGQNTLTHFRQGHCFTEEDKKFFLSLSKRDKEEVTKYSPVEYFK